MQQNTVSGIMSGRFYIFKFGDQNKFVLIDWTRVMTIELKTSRAINRINCNYDYNLVIKTWDIEGVEVIIKKIMLTDPDQTFQELVDKWTIFSNQDPKITSPNGTPINILDCNILCGDKVLQCNIGAEKKGEDLAEYKMAQRRANDNIPPTKFTPSDKTFALVALDSYPTGMFLRIRDGVKVDTFSEASYTEALETIIKLLFG